MAVVGKELMHMTIFLSVLRDRGPLYSKGYMNHVDDEGTSALHLAVQNGQSKVSGQFTF